MFGINLLVAVVLKTMASSPHPPGFQGDLFFYHAYKHSAAPLGVLFLCSSFCPLSFINVSQIHPLKCLFQNYQVCHYKHIFYF